MNDPDVANTWGNTSALFSIDPPPAILVAVIPYIADKCLILVLTSDS